MPQMHSLALMGTALPTLNAESLLALAFPDLISSLGQVAEDQVDVFMRMPHWQEIQSACVKVACTH